MAFRDRNVDKGLYRGDFGSVGGGRRGNRSRKYRAARGLLLAFVLSGASMLPGVAMSQGAPVFGDPALDIFVPGPLSAVPVPGPTAAELATYIADETALIRLGKALFWDMSVGSDGIQACASCHFRAGADPRSKNQLSPGLLGGDSTFQLGGPNYQLVADDFPFTTFTDPADRFSTRVGPGPGGTSVNDVTSSMGVHRTRFLNTIAGDPVDNATIAFDPSFTTLRDPVFKVGTIQTRRVEPRNTPTVINAVHNVRNFLDGRAAACFNGRSPFGQHDPAAAIWSVTAPGTGETPTSSTVCLTLSSLASQAVGPPESFFEMSASGRTFPDIGLKLLPMQPLMQQVVDPDDSVLGSLADAPTGLMAPADTYAKMVEAAFMPAYWDTTALVTTATGTYTLMQANFAFFFGFAVQAYERTLLAIDSKFDRVRRGALMAGGTPYAFTDSEKRGLAIFTNAGQNPDPDLPAAFCSACHIGAEFTGASVGAVGVVEPPAPGEPPAVPEFLVERMASGLGGAIAAIAMSTAPLADEIPFPAGFNLNPKKTPLKGTITVVSTCGGPNFSGSFGGTVLKSVGVKIVNLDPLPVTATDPLATAVVRVLADGIIIFELETLNLLPCTYNVFASGVTLGSIMGVSDIIYDLGFYNIAVTRFSDDLSVAAPGVNPDGHSLAFSQQIIDADTDEDGFISAAEAAHITAGIPPVIDPATGLPLELPVTVPADFINGAMVDGSFKVPGLLNVALTPPYFHNGGKKNLCEVLAFYNRGGDFHEDNIEWLDPEIFTLGMTRQDISDVVRFLLTLTDEGSRDEGGVFSHPELRVSNGHTGDDLAVTDTEPDGQADDDMVTIPAVGAAGKAAATITSPFDGGFLGLGDGGGLSACLALSPPPIALGAGGGALFAAVASGNKSLAKKLLKGGADANDADDAGNTALHAAVSLGRGDLVSLLIKRGADTSAQNDLGQTPLHWAARLGNQSIAKTLIKKMTATTINLRDLLGFSQADPVGPGNTALFYADDPATSLLLKNKGATI